MRKTRAAGMATIFAVLISTAGNQLHADNKSGEKEGNSKISARESVSIPKASEFSWNKEKKLSWDDFRGPIPANAKDRTAAATFCGIGFETNTISSKNANLKIRVYNTFYANSSWARPEDMNDDVLAHEQGHFDLCEIYTRKLRQRMGNLKLDVNTLRPTLRNVYEQLQSEYKARQQSYEEETAHGVNIAEQKRWQKILEKELGVTAQWTE